MFHSASLVENKLYVAGGAADDITFLKDTFYLDLSINFTLENPPFINDATTPNLTNSLDKMASAVGGKDNATIFLFGGYTNVRKPINFYTIVIHTGYSLYLNLATAFIY